MLLSKLCTEYLDRVSHCCVDSGCFNSVWLCFLFASLSGSIHHCHSSNVHWSAINWTSYFNPKLRNLETKVDLLWKVRWSQSMLMLLLFSYCCVHYDFGGSVNFSVGLFFINWRLYLFKVLLIEEVPEDGNKELKSFWFTC